MSLLEKFGQDQAIKQKAAAFDAMQNKAKAQQTFDAGRMSRDEEIAANNQMKQDYANAIMTESPENIPKIMEYAAEVFTPAELNELVAGRQALDMEAVRGGLAGTVSPQEAAMMQLQEETGQSNFQEQIPAGLAKQLGL